MLRKISKRKLFVIFVFALFAGFFLLKSKDHKTAIVSPLAKLATDSWLSPTPTQGPFYDITIPYLREREYKSTLGNLEEISQNSDYTSYLASYTSDGLQINGLLTIPKGDPSVSPQDDSVKHPAIVFIHGYIPPSQYQTTVNYASYVDYLARNGFVVFKIDLRGHAQSEGEPSGAYYSSDYIIDTLNAYAALESSNFVNPQKIGLWGHSMAGNVVMRSFAAKPTIPAIVIWAGAVYSYTDFREYGIDDNSYRAPQMSSERVQRRQQLIDTYGQPDEGNAFWKLVAPTSYLADLGGAVQLNHALDDNVVDIAYSRNLVSLLSKTSVPHEFNEYSSGGHNLTGAAFVQAMQKTVEFFNKNLK